MIENKHPLNDDANQELIDRLTKESEESSRKMLESDLHIRDFTAMYVYPGMILGAYLGWKLGFVICDAISKACAN